MAPEADAVCAAVWQLSCPETLGAGIWFADHCNHVLNSGQVKNCPHGKTLASDSRAACSTGIHKGGAPAFAFREAVSQQRHHYTRESVICKGEVQGLSFALQSEVEA